MSIDKWGEEVWDPHMQDQPEPEETDEDECWYCLGECTCDRDCERYHENDES